MKQLTLIAAAVLAVFASPVPVLAQQAAEPAVPAAPSAASTTTLDTVQVNADAPTDDFNATQSSLPRLGTDLHDVPQSVTVVNKALMQSQGANSLQDALRNVAGITL